MSELVAWVVDSLTKVFPTDRRKRTSPRAMALEAARNESASGQVALRSAGGATVRMVVSPLVHADGDARIDGVRGNFVGYVEVDPRDLARPRRRARTPLLFPDVLLAGPEVHLEGGRTQAAWVTIEVPPEARPGLYRGQVTLQTPRESVAVPVELTVHRAAVPARRRLYAGQWFSADGPLARHIPGAVYPREGFWSALRAIARDMHSHRQNVLRVPFGPNIGGPIAAHPTGINALAFDFTGFDRLVGTFIKEGAADLVAGMHLATRNENGALMLRGLLNVGGCLASVDLRPESPEGSNFLTHYLTALYRHLRFKGWLDRYVQQLCDGPATESDPAGYQALARQVRRHLPGVPLMETLLETKMGEQVEIRVPRLDHFLDRRRSYRERQRAGDQVWLYVSGDLEARFPNRFLDQSLLGVRLLYWMNFLFKTTGCVHSGYNLWEVEDPYRPTGLRAPAGAAWVVYPDRDGVLDSIRYEAIRDGIADYELLRHLADGHPRQAIALVRSVVKSGTEFTGSVTAFRRARRRLLELAGI